MLAFFAAIWLLLYMTDDHKYYGPSTGEARDLFLARMRQALKHRPLTPAEEDGMECCSDRPDHAGCRLRGAAMTYRTVCRAIIWVGRL